MQPKLVVSLFCEKQTFQRQQVVDARAAATRASVEVEILFAEGSLQTQIQQVTARLQAPVEARPAAFVVAPLTAAGLESLGWTAAQAGIGWVVIQSSPPYIVSLRQEYPNLPIGTVMADNQQAGSIQAQQYRALLPAGGQIVYIEGPGGSAATIDRRRGMEEGLKGSNVKVSKIVGADWTEAGAERAVAAWLRLKTNFRPVLVGSQNDSMAIGAWKAIQAARPEWTPLLLAGVDGLPEEGQRLVKEGVLAATVVMPTTAGKGVDLVARALKGEPMPSSVILPVQSYPPIEQLGGKRR